MITLRQRYQLPAGEQNAPLNGNKTDTPRENAQRESRAAWWKGRHGFKAWLRSASQMASGNLLSALEFQSRYGSIRVK